MGAPPPMAPPRAGSAPPAAQQAGAAPSMMGNFASSMAGSMAGNMMANAMFGGRSSEAPVAAEQPAAAAPSYMQAQPAQACQFENQQFMQCMSMTADNMDECKHLFEAFKHCSMQASRQQRALPPPTHTSSPRGVSRER